MNVIAIDPGLNGAGAVSDERGDFIACFYLRTIGESVQRRVDAAKSRRPDPRTYAVCFRNRRAGRRTLYPRSGRRRSPQQRRRNVTCSRDRDLAGRGRALYP
jgi:hypothetical protein